MEETNLNEQEMLLRKSVKYSRTACIKNKILDEVYTTDYW